MTAKSAKIIHNLEKLIQQDPGCRHFTSIVKHSHLFQSASQLLQDQRILIVTGFCVLDTMTGETDGPPGALVLGNALSTIGKNITYVTDQYSCNMLYQGMQQYSLTSLNPIITITRENTHTEITALIKQCNPDHIVSIERPGMAADGNTYSMRGESLNHVIPQLDMLFCPPSDRSYITTAIGDGGNEMGLGSFHDSIKAFVPMGQLIATTTVADYVIPAGISNWGGYALAAALSVLSEKFLLPPVGTEEDVIAAMVDVGAVDGCTKRSEVSVDGVDFKEYINVIEQISQIVKSALHNEEEDCHD